MECLRNGIGLRSAVIAVVLIPLLMVFGAGGLGVVTALERQLEARLEEDIALIARTLRVPLARALEREREYTLDRAMRSTSDFGRVYGVYVYDADGALVARADRLSHVRIPSLTPLDVQNERTSAEYRSVGGREVYSYFTPLTDSSGRAIGMLQVTRRASEIREYLAALRTDVAWLIIAFCALIVAIIVLGHHLAIGRPLRRLAGVMGRIASGEKGVRAAVRGPREIRALAQRFNGMLDGIAERDRILSVERRCQRTLENKLRQSEKYALVGRLAAGVAHELGAPLSVVDGHAQRLMRRSRAGSDEQRMLARMRESSARMATIVHDLLGFGRDSVDTASPIAVRRLVSLAAADTRAQAEETHTALEIAAGPPHARIYGDEARLRETLVHLLRNALYAARGGDIRIGWKESERVTQIFVENSGSPLAAGDRERIFEPFFTTKAPGDGSGLGLAIVKATVADHGADITVYDAPLGGAGFMIDFPRREAGA